MNPNRVKSMLKKGETALGTWVTIANPDVAEILSNMTFDWLVFDTEHGPLSIETVQWMIAATSATQVVPLVRVGFNDMVEIKRALDIGACESQRHSGQLCRIVRNVVLADAWRKRRRKA